MKEEEKETEKEEVDGKQKEQKKITNRRKMII